MAALTQADIDARVQAQAEFYASLDPQTRAFLLAQDLSYNAITQLSGPALPFRDVTVSTVGGAGPINFNIGVGVTPEAAAILRGEGAPAMPTLTDILNGVGTAVSTVIGALPTIAQTVATGAQAIGAIQQSLSGAPTFPTPQAMAPAMINGNTATSGADAFRAACSMDPTCTAAVWAALQGGNMNMMNGSGTTDAMMDAQLAALGFPPALIMQLRMIPGAIARLLGSPAGQIAVGVGGGIAGTAIGTSLLTGGMAMGMRLPRTIRVADGRGGVREYVSRGRPLLYSGDLSAMRRVKKVAQRVPRPRRSKPKPLLITAGETRHVCGKCLSAPCSC